MVPLNPRFPVVLAFCGVLVAILFFVFCSIEEFNWLLTDSDTLLPASLLNDVVNHPDSLVFFQLPRVPSLFPDLFLYFLITEIAHSWTWVIGIYACLMLWGMLFVCSLICQDLAQVSHSRTMLTIMACTMLALTLGTHLDGITNPYLYVMLPVYHSGPFLLALCGLIVAKACLANKNGKAHVILALIAALGTLSDRLFIGAFLAPFLGFVLLHSVLAKDSERVTLSRNWTVVFWALMGCVAGYLCDLLIFSHWLSRQPDLPIDLRRQFGRWKLVWHDGNIRFECLCTVFILAVSLARLRRNRDESYWLAVACISSIGFLLIQPLLWDGPASSRYAQPIWWWTLLVAAVMLCRIRWRFMPGVLLLVSAATLGVFVSSRRETFQLLPVIERPEPLAACLIQLKKEGLIHDGLADYWVARPTEVKSGWWLQIEQITPQGLAFVWGNNAKYYSYSRQSSRQPAVFDYIIVKNLDEGQLTRRFGSPDQTARCPTSDIWIYRDPDRLRLNLGDIATAMDRGGFLRRSACLGPGQFTNQSGPIPASGIDMSADAQPQSFATWGPYMAMRHGEWDLDLTYRLKKGSPQPDIWDVAADYGQMILAQTDLSGTAGGIGNQTIVMNLSKDTPRVEFRTRLSAGDHLEIVNLRIQRHRSSGDPCGADAVQR